MQLSTILPSCFLPTDLKSTSSEHVVDGLALLEAEVLRDGLVEDDAAEGAVSVALTSRAAHQDRPSMTSYAGYGRVDRIQLPFSAGAVRP